MFNELNNSILKKNFYFFALLILFIWLAFKNPDIALMLFASIIFACSLAPLVDKLSKKMSRTLATTIVLGSLIIISCILIIPILLLGAYQVTSFAIEFPNYIVKLNNSISQIPLLKSFGIISINMEQITNALAASSSIICEAVIDFLKETGSAFLYIFTSIIFIFFMLADKKLIRENFLNIFPSEIRENTDKLVCNISEKLGGYVVAQAVVSGSVWITMTLGLLLFKINYALVLGLIAGILSIIPVVGSAISLIICLIATYEMGIKALIIVTIMFTISHFIENHVVRPYIYSKFLSLHPIIVFLALFVGAKYAGVIGVIFAPPIAMALCILLDELYSKEME